MQKNFSSKVVCTTGGLNWLPGFRKLIQVLGVTLGVALLSLPMQVRSAALVSSYSAPLAWNRSPDPDVTGYRIYYGTTSGNYTNSILVGNVASNTIPGLVVGVTYFFAVTSYYGASGQQSVPSNEITFTPGAPTVNLRVLANRQAVVTVKGLIGHAYEVQATTNLTSWSVLGTVTLGASATTNITDTGAASLSKRFYRTRDIAP